MTRKAPYPGNFAAVVAVVVVVVLVVLAVTAALAERSDVQRDSGGLCTTQHEQTAECAVKATE